MTLDEHVEAILPALEMELQRQIRRLDQPGIEAFHDMLAYHMGWNDQAGSASTGGKRIRPLLMLLVVGACGEEWLRAISPAASIEILHNFSLVHDDVEDNSPTRRGRPTIWHRYGLPMAVNVGDALFVISNQAMLDAAAYHPPEIVMIAASKLHAACLALTKGQFLDMSYEKRTDLSVEDYWPMVDGKTAALLAASTEIGAILAGADANAIQQFGMFGRNLGLAFQVQDDILGIWGNESATGKSTASDLVEGKNSLPILYGVGQKGGFARRWEASPIAPEETAKLADLLKAEGAYDYCQGQAARLTELALTSLRNADPRGSAGAALVELADKLLKRQS
jgi:geranylgeranyl diphosphate synthase type I